jgi:predicted NAD-dependent protein-ADP-ribosyltransferase YbiA (DUF1768 family)
MEAILRNKFRSQNPLATLLKETGDELLVEGNYWKDQEWGAIWAEGGAGKAWAFKGGQVLVGKNKLGKLLMKIRTELNDGR